MDTILIEKWGKDHWSLLGFFEYWCTNGDKGDALLGIKGKFKYMRCNADKQFDSGVFNSFRPKWESSYSTRLKGYFEDKDNSELQVNGHDDFDCMDEIEEAGLIICGTLVTGSLKFTKIGIKFANELLAHKLQGNNYADFTPSDKLLKELEKIKDSLN